MSRSKLRRITLGDEIYLWRLDWSYRKTSEVGTPISYETLYRLICYRDGFKHSPAIILHHLGRCCNWRQIGVVAAGRCVGDVGTAALRCATEKAAPISERGRNQAASFSDYRPEEA